MRAIVCMLSAALLATSSVAATITIVPTSTTAGSALPMHIGGRVERTVGGYKRQWPGTYFETAFRGRGVLVAIGQGDVMLRISVDSLSIAKLVKPKLGLYQIEGLTDGLHSVRVEVVSESQAAPTVFGGFYATKGTRSLPFPARSRRIAFIGDSHTVGYGNVSTKRDCTEAEVWATTDTSQGVPAQTARRYGADYEVDAISGRGIVRNYDGMPGDTLPEAYSYTLFDKATHYADFVWHPQLIVIALGTNDFSTPLKASEPWKTRDALRAAFETHYVGFVMHLRARDPDAHVLLWATDLADGEIAAEVTNVVAKLKASGENNIAFVPVTGLAFSGCHAHPSTSDGGRIATALSGYIDAHPEIWNDATGARYSRSSVRAR